MSNGSWKSCHLRQAKMLNHPIGHWDYPKFPGVPGDDFHAVVAGGRVAAPSGKKSSQATPARRQCSAFGVCRRRRWQMRRAFGVCRRRRWQMQRAFGVRRRRRWQMQRAFGVCRRRRWQMQRAFVVRTLLRLRPAGGAAACPWRAKRGFGSRRDTQAPHYGECAYTPPGQLRLQLEQWPDAGREIQSRPCASDAW